MDWMGFLERCFTALAQTLPGGEGIFVNKNGVFWCTSVDCF